MPGYGMDFIRKLFGVSAVLILMGITAAVSSGLPRGNAASVAGISAPLSDPPSDCNYINTVIGTQPLAFFPFDSATEGSVVNGYTLAPMGTPTLTAPGAPLHCSGNKTLALNGNESYVVASLFGGIPGTGSMIAWVNLAELPSDAGRYFYISGESQYGNDFDLQFENDNNLYFYTGSGEHTVYTPDSSTLVGKWHMVAATYIGGTSGVRSIYWDGKLAAQDTASVNAEPKTTQFNIGESLVFMGRAFYGRIDDVAVWNFALTTQQVQAIAKSSL